MPQYDYTQPGGYFVTICCQDRTSLFGEVEDGEMHPNAAGQMVQEEWHSLTQRFPHISLDAFMVMPNHVHGILGIEEERSDQGLGQIIGAFKSITTTRYIAGVRRFGWPAFNGKLWQDNYFEHVVRDDRGLDEIRVYIIGNPSQWEKEPERFPFRNDHERRSGTRITNEDHERRSRTTGGIRLEAEAV